MREIRMMAAYKAGCEDRDTGRNYSPPSWVLEDRRLVRYYEAGFYGKGY